MTLNIITIESAQDIQACFTVLSQLREHLTEETFLELIQNQYKRGYQLVAVKLDGSIVAVAGFHIQENLAWGKYLYIKALVIEKNTRSSGVGKALLNWLHQKARENNYQKLHLDSGIQRKDAHHFYEREEMMFASHHYVSKL